MSRPTEPPRAARGGISIRVSRNGQAVADDTLSTTVGQVWEITAYIDGVPAVECEWTVPMQAVVQDYEPTVQGATLVPVTPADLASNPITLAFWQPGAYVISCVAPGPEGPIQGQMEVDCDAPVATLVGEIGVVRVGPGDDDSWWLQLASDDAQPLGPEQTGIQLQGAVSQAPIAGTIGFIQLVTPARYGIQGGQPVAYSLNGQNVLDMSGGQGSVFYQDTTSQVQQGGENGVAVDDAPALYVIPSMNWSAMQVGVFGPEIFQTFLMYQPQGGICVPLSVISWSWQGQTVQDGGGAWGPLQNGGQFLDQAGDAPNNFPIWTTTAGAGVFGAATRPQGTRVSERRARGRVRAAPRGIRDEPPWRRAVASFLRWLSRAAAR